MRIRFPVVGRNREPHHPRQSGYGPASCKRIQEDRGIRVTGRQGEDAVQEPQERALVADVRDELTGEVGMMEVHHVGQSGEKVALFLSVSKTSTRVIGASGSSACIFS